jgi:hypothetical protein
MGSTSRWWLQQPPRPMPWYQWTSWATRCSCYCYSSCTVSKSRWCRSRGNPDQIVASIGASTPTTLPASTSPSTPLPPALPPPPQVNGWVASGCFDPCGEGWDFLLGHRRVEMVGKSWILKRVRHKWTSIYKLSCLLYGSTFFSWLGRLPGLEWHNRTGLKVAKVCHGQG